MRCLLDTHIIVSMLQHELALRFPGPARVVQAANFFGYVSVASAWEIALKSRLGKLFPLTDLDTIPQTLQAIGLSILPVTLPHVLHTLDPEPPTRDPFDRLLLAQCHVEGLKLITVDRALVDHPLAFRP
ncbi:type II toxin-antitoxin system VapC family toxin [Rhizobium sp. AG855]|uniref:type II toxin-antitoxin system VapC family toxin n=1 Tax=Rhizobium sp. AG855 TaxID=2183898 RepID=UPI000E75FBBE|nr:type II toxin-antitoxin system VapC family toxin [Rhizobium sp. AG855]RKE84199.1 PIN domain nuclease of toxin-antitoxin system [Rhizobium sp. AG855]